MGKLDMPLACSMSRSGRPDAIGRVEGHGPYLQMHWQHVAEEDKNSWSVDQQAYVGSVNDGRGDPQIGYALYDDLGVLCTIQRQAILTQIPEVKKGKPGSGTGCHEGMSSKCSTCTNA